MPPTPLIEPEHLNTDSVVYDKAYIYGRMPHRYEFEMLDGVVFLDRERELAVAYRDCRPDDWWVRGHVPGRPIFPGVLQLEAAAQLVAFISRYVDGSDVFVGFGGVENCRFRETVEPPSRLYLVTKLAENRPRRVKGDVQGFVDGRMVFDGRIIGVAMPAANP